MDPKTAISVSGYLRHFLRICTFGRNEKTIGDRPRARSMHVRAEALAFVRGTKSHASVRMDERVSLKLHRAAVSPI